MRSLAVALVLAGVIGTAALAQEGAVVFQRPGGPADPPPATFPHWVHRIRFTCYACHPGEIKRAAAPITHDAMATGQACGACHDGRVAWGISFATCHRCHVAR